MDRNRIHSTLRTVKAVLMRRVSTRTSYPKASLEPATMFPCSASFSRIHNGLRAGYLFDGKKSCHTMPNHHG